VIRTDYQINPLLSYLRHEGLTPADFSVLARVDCIVVYNAIQGKCRVLPATFVQAIDDRTGTGSKIAGAYLDYRETMRHSLLPTEA
jgi:hypothetical protein